MGYQIFSGHRLESLVEAHSSLLTSSFLGPRPGIVLQSQSLAQWLKLYLARLCGGYATGDFLFQDEALRRLLQGQAPSTQPVLFLDDLKFALYRHLSVVLSHPIDPVFLPLVGHEGPPDPVRLFELSDHIAGVFHNYAMNSALWPGALAEGKLPEGSKADPRAFAWQSRLWRELLGGEKGTLAGVRMAQLTLAPPAPSNPPSPLVLVGSAFLSRRAAAFLRSWASAGLVDVVHLLLLPCPAATLSVPSIARPWSSWGAFGRGFLDSLPQQITSSPDVGEAAPATALNRLQRSLAEGKPFDALTPDGTLEVVSSPHPLRELEALRDRLLSALAQDPGLEMHEIAVLAPDINVYAPFLDAVFRSDDPGRNLAYHVIDLDLGRENAWFRALDAVLALVSGSIDRPTLFALIDTPAFAQAREVEPDDRDLWLDYTELVSAWREEGSRTSETSPQSWTQSWDRLFSGWFRAATDSPETPPPLDTSPSAFRSLGRFHRLLESLRDRGRETRQARSFLEWIRFLEQTMAEFLAPGDGTGAALAGRLRTLVLDAGAPEDTLAWAGFRSFVQDQIAHFPGRRGQLLTEGIHCSSLRPLRAIPFRVIAVLGLDEGRFPGHAPTPSFDLRRHEPGQEEVSSLALDRYTFWETIMAARSLLYLSYQGRSPIDGTERPPSAVLADLLDYLDEAGAPWPVTQTTVKDFALGTSTAVVWSPRTLRRLQALGQASPQTSLPSVPAPSTEEAFPEVRSADVVMAFTAPARFHLQKVQQVLLEDEDRRSVDEEEPWSLGFLERQAWLQEGLRRTLAGGEMAWDAPAFLRSMMATGRVREGVFAEGDLRELQRQGSLVEQWSQQLLSEGWRADTAPFERRNWVGRPWAVEPRDRLVRGDEVLLPRLLYAQAAPARTKVEAAVRFLLDPADAASLATMTPEGQREVRHWSLGTQETLDLTATAERYWALAASRPLPFYPDLLEALAKRRSDNASEPWPLTLEESWRMVRNADRIRSAGTLTRCPYAALAFPGEPDAKALADELAPWWETLFLPLLEAWK